MTSSVSLDSSCLGQAETGTIGISAPNLVNANRVCNFFVYVNIIYSLSGCGNISTLFIATMSLSISISPSTMHSAVYVCTNFCASTTSIIMSMILAPPIIVFMREAWPGQSTRVNYMKSRESGIECLSRNQEGMRMMKAEKPRSRVIPRA